MPSTTLPEFTLHNLQFVEDCSQFIVGCTCGWTCSGHVDDLPLVGAVYRVHKAAAR
jgi:hypothetical protein